MYQTSHTYTAMASYSRLETLASSSFSEGVSYSINTMLQMDTSSSLYARFSSTSLGSSHHSYISDLAHFDTVKPYQSQLHSYLSLRHEEYHFAPETFLKPGKEGRFIGHATEIKEEIEQAFESMFHLPFPQDINVSILDALEFRKIAPHPGTVGVSFNRRKHGLISEIFVLNDTLARVMLTIGHELGHVLTTTLGNAHDEEAKAYAFSLAWMKTIKEQDIAGLASAIIDELPAQNGLHNVAFSFVQRILQTGKMAWQIYLDLIQKEISVGFIAG